MARLLPLAVLSRELLVSIIAAALPGATWWSVINPEYPQAASRSAATTPPWGLDCRFRCSEPAVDSNAQRPTAHPTSCKLGIEKVEEQSFHTRTHLGVRLEWHRIHEVRLCKAS